jgi:DNA circularisation protein N-terminus
MGYLDTLEHWQFDDIPLAIESASVKIGIRKAEHVYPHSPGAALEKMGRKLYVTEVEGFFDINLPQSRYPNPMEAMQAMRLLTDTETTSDLVIPWCGTMQAVCEDLTLREKNTVRSGLRFSATFCEDMSNQYALADFVRVNQVPMSDALVDIQDHKYQADIFSQIANAVGFILGIKDQFELYTALVDSKLRYLEQLFRHADATASELNDPANIIGHQRFFQMWQAVRDFGNDIAEKGLSFRYFVVPYPMTLQEVANAIPGYSSRAFDLLGLNIIDDSTTIRAGTRIRYYEAT